MPGPPTPRNPSRFEVLALATYPVEGASTRFRISQFVDALRVLGVETKILPFLEPRTFMKLYDRRNWWRTALTLLLCFVRRMAQLPRLWRSDAVFVQREAMLLGPPIVEWVATRLARRPMVLDLDDPTYLEPVSPVYGRMARLLKWPGKTDWLIDHSAAVICGNSHIADHVRARTGSATVMQTIVDTSLFAQRPAAGDGDPTIGWIGSQSTFQYLEAIIPVLEELARQFRFRVRIVGSGRDQVEIRGVPVEVVPWRLEREVADFQSIDIGLYPLPLNDPWAVAKSGLKAIAYMSVGVPYVASPVGVLTDIGEAGKTHFLASAPEQWRDALARLLGDASLRAQMGEAGREYAVAHYPLGKFAEQIAEILRAARPAEG